MHTFPLLLSLCGSLLAGQSALAETAAARISQLNGPVELRHHGKSASNLAQIDASLTAKSRLITRSHGRAELLIAGNRVRLDAESELELQEAGARRVVLKLHSGSVFVDSNPVAGAQRLELVSGSGRVLASGAAQLRVDSSGADATAVRLFSGAAQFIAAGSNPLALESGQQMVWRNGQIRQAAIGPDEFDDWCLGRAAASGRQAGYGRESSDGVSYRPAQVTYVTTSAPATGTSDATYTTYTSSATSTGTTGPTYTSYPAYPTYPAYPATAPVYAPAYVNPYPYWGHVALDVGLWLTLGHYWYRGGYGHYRHHGYHGYRAGHYGGYPHGQRHVGPQGPTRHR